MKNKNAIVTVVAVVGFQGWFTTFSSSMFTKAETKSTGTDFTIETLIGDTLYIKSLKDNISINTIKIGGVDCNLNTTLSTGMNNITVSSCLSSVTSTTPDIVLISNNGIADKQVYLKPIPSLSFPITSSTFISTWNTSLAGSTSDTIILPLEGTGTYNFTIDWGDDYIEDIIGTARLPLNHTYVTSGVYTIKINGEIKGFRFNNGGDKLKILDISQWGSLNVGNSGYYFWGASNLNITASDALNLTGTTDLSYMFFGATSFNVDISTWDVSSVINMADMFRNANIFNQDISNWNVSSVNNMDYMFYGASSFNQPLDSWDVSKVTYMNSMFYVATNFNHPLNSWNVSKVTSMNGMFSGASSFNQPLNSWNVSKVTTTGQMFYGASKFNQSLNSWDMSNVNSIYRMFQNAIKFNQDISGWNISTVNNMYYTFSGATNFNQDLSGWTVAQVTTCGNVYTSTPAWVLPKPNFTSCTP